MTARGAEATAPHTGILLLAALSLFWGINWPIMKIGLSEVPPWTFRAICLALGGGGLLAIAWAGGLPLRIPRAELRPLLLVGLFNITIWHLMSATGIANMAAGHASIIAFTMPLWAAVLAVPLLGERLARTTLAGLAVGLAGMAALVIPDWRAIAAAPLGPLLMLGAAMSWAAGTVGLKYYRWSMPVIVLTGWQLALGGAPVVLGALVFERGFEAGAVSAEAWLATLYAATIPMTFCHWAWYRTVALYPAVVAAVGTLAIPVIGVASSAVALSEPIGADAIAALVLVLGALTLVLILPALRRARTASLTAREVADAG